MIKKNKVFLAAAAALCAFTLLIPLTGGFAAETDPVEGASENANLVTPGLGDIDLDGEITPADARLALRNAVNFDDGLTKIQLKLADVDHSGTITPADARYILRAAVGLEDIYNLQPIPEEPSEAANPVDPIPVPSDPIITDI